MDAESALLVEARKFERKLLNFFYRQGVQTSECEDLLQETYLRLWRYRRRYRPSAKLSTFLFLMARQVRIDALRRSARREQRERSWMSERPVETTPDNRGARDDVRWALARLPRTLREVVELGVFQDLPYAEISDILSIPVGTVKSRMHYALKKLKEIFDDKRPSSDLG